MPNRGANRPITSPQIETEIYFATVNSDGTCPIANEGYDEVTTATTGTGVYTVVPKLIGSRVISVFGAIPETANLSPSVTVVDSTNVITVSFTNNSGTATNTKFRIGFAISYDIMKR